MIPLPIFPTHQFRFDKTINFAFPGMWARASAVGAGRLNHYAIIHRHMVYSRQATKLGILPVPLPSPPHTKLGLVPLYLCLSCPHTGSQQKVPMATHSTPIQVHTSISRELHPSSTVCSHTPAPLFPHPRSLPFCKSQLTSLRII